MTLSPLSTPPHRRRARWADFAAVQILVNRAQQARPGFAVAPENARAVAETVRRLKESRLPSSWLARALRLLTPLALLHRLDQRLDLSSYDVDAPSRQHTLRRTIAWSYDLLNDSERTLLGRLSAFAAAGRSPALRRCAWATRRQTSSKRCRHSSSTTSPSQTTVRTEPRFRMLETVREYVLEQLRESGGSTTRCDGWLPTSRELRTARKQQRRG